MSHKERDEILRRKYNRCDSFGVSLASSCQSVRFLSERIQRPLLVGPQLDRVGESDLARRRAAATDAIDHDADQQA